MKNILWIFCFITLLSSCIKKEEKQINNNESTKQNIESEINKNTVFSFDINTLKEGCETQSQMICTINYSIKCTINPTFSECKQYKAFMPNFIFMQDESLKRPTSQSYKITKIKPLADGTIEVYTQSTCNGNWFGLCNGNIIYVMDYQNNQWTVKDIYAIEI
ncbi:MAG: hypothetical protein E7012_00515 [Alphaproteobacteria bacterium]|nr:hypothetical protein [Alphaproteobacteria bacterium]